MVPSLSRSLAEQFNVFRVMHHGTHEKQLSNVFAWLLRVDGSHELGDAFQRHFVDLVNESLRVSKQLPTSAYRVVQEVDTSGHDDPGKDIADIVLTNTDASIVIENFETSSGHGHDYWRYLRHAEAGGKHGVVVLLCARHEPDLLKCGWENAVVVTYAELLERLKKHVEGEAAWLRAHPQQNFFVNQLVQHFVEVPGAVDINDQIEFIKTMCDTGESARYGYIPNDVAAQEFAALLAQHAKRQFDEGRKTLAEVKRSLRRYAEQTLKVQVNDALRMREQTSGLLTSVHARFAGQWEWCVTLERADSNPPVFLEFGPTAVVENARVPVPLVDPDYTRVFVTRRTSDHDGIDQIRQTVVGLDEVLAGMSAEDTGLRDAVLAVINAA